MSDRLAEIKHHLGYDTLTSPMATDHEVWLIAEIERLLAENKLLRDHEANRRKLGQAGGECRT